MKRTQLMKRAIAIGIVGTIALGESVPSLAAPVLSSTAVVKTTAPNMLDQVRVRRRAIGAGVALGVLGAVAGIAAARSQYYYRPGFYGPGYYGPSYYGPSYYGPGYYGPYGGYPYPYGYGYGYNYNRSGALAAGAAVGVIGAIIATAAARNPRLYRGGRYQPYGYYYNYNDPHSPW